MRSNRPSFWGSLSGADRFMVGNLFFLYFVQGVFVIGIGSILPMMKAEYGLSYEAGGMLISAHNIGSLITGLIMGMLPPSWVTNAPCSISTSCRLPALRSRSSPETRRSYFSQSFSPALDAARSTTIITRSSTSYRAARPARSICCTAFLPSERCSRPFLVLLCTRGGDSGWRTAVYIIIGMGIVSMATSPMMKMDSVSPEGGQAIQPGTPSGFLRERLFWLTTVIMLCYLSVEASVMGWLVTYFIDSGAASESSAQMLTALLWVVILLGRSACVIIANKVAPPQFLVVASIGIAAFLIVVLVSPGFAPLLAGTIGLGLCMAGMYGTAVSNATGVFKQYPMAMSVFVTITGIGSVIAPSVIGAVAGQLGMRAGLSVLLLPAALLIAFALYNFKKHG